MKKIILSEEETININKVEDYNVIATKVPDSNDGHKVYFLSGTSNACCFTNLYGYSLGAYRDFTLEEAIKHRINGTDVSCKPTNVYIFGSIREALDKLGDS